MTCKELCDLTYSMEINRSYAAYYQPYEYVGRVQQYHVEKNSNSNLEHPIINLNFEMMNFRMDGRRISPTM
ncbi:hypothetical protein TNCV_4989911 [Trichonephila clavipes]|uniref:Uncharacterized protein n=1 Tax=Trichonephila clavipes TaxID=2585209 RepID=A0A8X6WAI8_TRICX|nr:hypothetical protein TNCV_4989911 [Trichonephila clavipes]